MHDRCIPQPRQAFHGGNQIAKIREGGTGLLRGEVTRVDDEDGTITVLVDGLVPIRPRCGKTPAPSRRAPPRASQENPRGKIPMLWLSVIDEVSLTAFFDVLAEAIGQSEALKAEGSLSPPGTIISPID